MVPACLQTVSVHPANRFRNKYDSQPVYRFKCLQIGSIPTMPTEAIF